MPSATKLSNGLQRRFPRRIEALDQVFAFHREAVAAMGGLPDDTLRILDFVVEELFTNLVKYQPGPAPIDIELRCEPAPGESGPGRLCATLTGPEARVFDPTRAPEVAIDLPIESRRPGGLGLHLLRHLAVAVEYAHDPLTDIGRTRAWLALPPFGLQDQTEGDPGDVRDR